MDFSKMWQLAKFQQEAMKVKKELENTYIESEVDGLVITINWEMKAEKAEFENDNLVKWLTKEQQEALCKAMVESFNKWVRESQKVAADKMQWIMGQMWMWDMMNQLWGMMK